MNDQTTEYLTDYWILDWLYLAYHGLYLIQVWQACCLERESLVFPFFPSYTNLFFSFAADFMHLPNRDKNNFN